MQTHSSSLQPLSALLQMPCHICEDGPTDRLLSRLSFLHNYSPILSEPTWTLLKKPAAPENRLRQLQLNEWGSDADLLDPQYRCYRGVYICLDFLQSFVVAGHESAFITAKLFAEESDESPPDLYVAGSCNLNLNDNSSLEALDTNEEQKNLVSDFIFDLYHIFDDLQTGCKWQLVIDMTVSDNFRTPRTQSDANEVACLAIITAHLLLTLLDLPPRFHHDLSFVKMISGSQYSLPVSNNTMIRIFARWPDVPFDPRSRVQTLTEEFEANQAGVKQIVAAVSDLRITSETRNILLIGRTGSGKSHTGNWILDNICENCESRFKESSSGSMTSGVERLPLRNSWLAVWDTPGLDDSLGQDNKHLDEIERCMLEIGTINAVIICFDTAHRIDGKNVVNIAQYKRLIGSEMAGHVMLVVTGQPKALIPRQRRSLIEAMRRHASLEVPDSHVFDLGPNADDLQGNSEAALRTLRILCDGKPFKASYFDRLQRGLLEIENLSDCNQLQNARDILVHLSEQALIRKLQHPRRPFPLYVRPSLRNEIVLSDGCIHKLKDGGKRYVMHVLHLPEGLKRSIFCRTLQALGRVGRADDSTAVVKLVREKRLVFMELESDERQEQTSILLRNICRIHYQLWKVDSALTDDMKANLRKAIGNDFTRTVSAFQSLREEPPQPERANHGVGHRIPPSMRRRPRRDFKH